MVVRMRSGCSPPERLLGDPLAQAIVEKTEFCAAQSRKFAGEASSFETPVLRTVCETETICSE